MSLETDVYGPIKEEALYRGPLILFPNVPFGTTALIFAVDHVIDDMRTGSPSMGDLFSRFGDVLLGGCAYEYAMRQNGIFAAIGAHSLHNMAVSLGSRARGTA